jgi:hypothetical protein
MTQQKVEESTIDTELNNLHKLLCSFINKYLNENNVPMNEKYASIATSSLCFAAWFIVELFKNDEDTLPQKIDDACTYLRQKSLEFYLQSKAKNEKTTSH